MTKVDPTMYALYGRPWNDHDTITTSFFVTYLFAKVFNSTFNDVAISFHEIDDITFGGPIISTVVNAAELIVNNQTTAPGGGIWYRYGLRQTPQQESSFSLDELFGGFADDNEDAVSTTYRQCVLMIGDDDPDTFKATRQRMMPGEKGRSQTVGGRPLMDNTKLSEQLEAYSRDAFLKTGFNQGFVESNTANPAAERVSEPDG